MLMLKKQSLNIGISTKLELFNPHFIKVAINVVQTDLIS